MPFLHKQVNKSRLNPIIRSLKHRTERTPLRVAFGKIVREKRLALGLSQEKLAEKADLHINYVGSVERGERNIALENIYALAYALNCSAKELISES
ncbi:MAG: helix-turn-helix transcriptional regulator [Parachlamydiales bacterium]|jgi:ribosome-binding protein aMBF1 (putative translation factor)